MQTSTFWLKFGSLSATVTLKIRSRSLKPNQIFIMSQCYICANLIQICQPVHEISCRHFSQWFMQTSTFGLNLAVTFSLGQDHQNLISSSSYPISMQIWLKSAYWFMRYHADKKPSRRHRCWSWCRRDPHQNNMSPSPSAGGHKYLSFEF